MKRTWLVGLLVAGATACVSLGAGSAPAIADTVVPHFSVVVGSVTVRGTNGVQAAIVNMPVHSGDYLSSGPDSRAEINFNGDTILRIGPNAQAHLVDAAGQMQLADGTVEVSVLHGGYGTAQIDTPSVTVRASEKGSYRITILPNGATQISARRGRVEVLTPQRTYGVDSGSSMIANGPAANPSIVYANPVAQDAFDRFSNDRDQTLASLPSQYAGDDQSVYTPVLATPYYGYAIAPAAILVSPVCTYGPGFANVGFGYGLTIGFGGFAGGCGYYSALALGGFYPWGYAPWYGYGYGGYAWNPYPWGWYPGWWGGYPGGGGQPIRIVKVPVRVPPPPVRTTTGRTGAVPVTPIAPVTTVPIARVAPVERSVAVAPRERPVAVERSAPVSVPRAAIARQPADATTRSAVSEPWRRFDTNRGTDVAKHVPITQTTTAAAPSSSSTTTTIAHPGSAPTARDEDTWSHFTTTRGSVSVTPVTPVAPVAPSRGSLDGGTGLRQYSGSTGTTTTIARPVSPGATTSIGGGWHGSVSGGGAAHGGGRPPNR